MLWDTPRNRKIAWRTQEEIAKHPLPDIKPTGQRVCTVSEFGEIEDRYPDAVMYFITLPGFCPLDLRSLMQGIMEDRSLSDWCTDWSNLILRVFQTMQLETTKGTDLIWPGIMAAPWLPKRWGKRYAKRMLVHPWSVTVRGRYTTIYMVTEDKTIFSDAFVAKKPSLGAVLTTYRPLVPATAIEELDMLRKKQLLD